MGGCLRQLAQRLPPRILRRWRWSLPSGGVQSPAELQWLDTPPDAAYGQAQALLRQLGGLDDAGRITPFGRLD